MLKAFTPMDVTLDGIERDVTGTLSKAPAAMVVTPSGMEYVVAAAPG